MMRSNMITFVQARLSEINDDDDILYVVSKKKKKKKKMSSFERKRKYILEREIT